MKKGLFPKLLPHLIAIVVFIIVAVIYCKPALEGKVVNQHDITNWKAAIHQSQVYKETHGQYPLWTNSMFSGMPAFQIGFPANNVVPWIAHTIFTLGLPEPIQFFFLACICFYFLCCVLRINPYIGIVGALAFAYATYDPVIISVGHDTKMWSIAYMPALLGSILLIFERRNYWLGAALTALIASVMVAMNHPQIDYYFFIAVAIMTVFYLVRWIREKDFSHLIKSMGFVIVAALIGLLVNAVTFLSTYQYQKETIRGGSSEVGAKSKEDSKTGLDKSYAFSYSFSITEPIVLMFPRTFGGSYPDHEEVKQDESKAIDALRAMPQELQQEIQYPKYYWGGMIGANEVGTSGPPYVGSIICFLAIIGLFIVDKKYKWWIATTIALTIIMSWGKYFDGFNSILYHYLPFYNKFRAPSMALVITQLMLPLLAVLTLDKVITVDQRNNSFKYLKKGLIAVGLVLAAALFCYISFDFLSAPDKEMLQRVNQANQPQLTQYIQPYIDGLKSDRKGLMMSDILRAFGFCITGAILLLLALKKTLKPVMAAALFGIVVLIDLLTIDSTYLNSNSYQDPEENSVPFQKTATDNDILKDTSYYRVLNVAGDAFFENLTSYYYNSIGGYHPAKLRIYQDLIEKQLYNELNTVGTILQGKGGTLDSANIPVLNMLNTKYFVAKDPRTQQTQYRQQNPGAMGPVWFVKNVRFVKDANEEINALTNSHPKDTAILQENFRNGLNNQSSWSADGTIKLVKNDNDIVEYKSNSNATQLAVFSEIYYDAGWKAFIDNKELPILKANYVLRALPVPAGSHSIVFKFEPSDYIAGRKLTTIFSILLLLLLAAGIFFEWRRTQQPSTT